MRSMTKTADSDTKPLVIFRAGTHIASDGRAYTFSESDVRDIADSYEPAVHEAPLVVGHPKTDDPAYGWALSLSEKDGELAAEPHQVEPQFAEMVNKGRFKKISASVYLPGMPGNPKPGRFYLRHVGFLGAQPPGVKGLPSASFAAGDGALEFSMPIADLGWRLSDLFQRVRDFLIDDRGLEVADQVIPQWQIRSIDEITKRDNTHPSIGSAFSESQIKHSEPDMSQQNHNAAEFAERERKITEERTNLEAREKVLKDREAAAQRDDAVAFAEGLIKDGKLLPRHKAPVVELLLALPAGTSLNFAEGEQQVQKPAPSVLRELLSSLPEQIDFNEKSGAAGAEEARGIEFAAPPGAAVDGTRAELHSKALAYQREHKGTSYMDAVKAVGGR